MKKAIVAAVCIVVVVAIIAFAFFFPGQKFVGVWVADNGQECLDISRDNGKEFIVRRTAPSMFGGQIRTEEYNGHLVDDRLVINLVLIKLEAIRSGEKLVIQAPFQRLVFRKGTKSDIAGFNAKK